MSRKLIFFLALIILLSGCCGVGSTCPDRPPRRLPPPPRNILVELAKQGVQIIRTGQTYIIIIPSDNLFYPDSYNFGPNAPAILGPLTDYLRCYEIIIMKVAGYTDNSGSFYRNRVLSERQAQNVVAYLTAQKIDARVIYATGYGAYSPIATNETPAGRAKNRRIEIRFRKVVIPPLV